MKKRILFLSTMIILILNACKKEEVTTQEKITARWKIQNIEGASVSGSTTTSSNYVGLPSDYIDFRTDNKIYSSVNGTVDTASYAVSGNTITVTPDPGDAPLVYEVKSVSNTDLQLYNRNTISATAYTAITVNLKK
ncbi:MAG: lipocalin family protein [Bacteroidota bacterium]